MYKIGITKEQFDKWLVALRSGEFKQAYDFLKTDKGYCCLGVLAYTIDPRGYEIDAESNHVYYFGTHIMYSAVIEEWIESNIQDKLTIMNDKDKLSFKEIADWIEANLEPINK